MDGGRQIQGLAMGLKDKEGEELGEWDGRKGYKGGEVGGGRGGQLLVDR